MHLMIVGRHEFISVTDDKNFLKLTDCVHLRNNKSQKVSIKNVVYASSNKTLKMKKCQLTRLVILVLIIYHNQARIEVHQ